MYQNEPLRVRLRSTQPLASSSRLHMPRKFSSRTNSLLKLPFELLPVPVLFVPLSVRGTAGILRVSFTALAFNVAAPRRAVVCAIWINYYSKRQFHHKFSKKKQNITFWNGLLCIGFWSMIVCILQTRESDNHRKTQQQKQLSLPVAASTVKVMISPSDRTLTAKLTTDAKWSCSVGMGSSHL